MANFFDLLLTQHFGAAAGVSDPDAHIAVQPRRPARFEWPGGAATDQEPPPQDAAPLDTWTQSPSAPGNAPPAAEPRRDHAMVERGAPRAAQSAETAEQAHGVVQSPMPAPARPKTRTTRPAAPSSHVAAPSAHKQKPPAQPRIQAAPAPPATVQSATVQSTTVQSEAPSIRPASAPARPTTLPDTIEPRVALARDHDGITAVSTERRHSPQVVVRVHIGRMEVQGAPAPPRSPTPAGRRPAAAVKPARSLESYLRHTKERRP